MSLRGRVIRRRPYACFITPMSAQQEQVEFVRYCNMFNANPYIGFSGSPNTLLPKLLKLGWYFSFPYPAIMSETLKAKWEPTDMVWLRVPTESFQFNAYMMWAGGRDTQYRAIVVIDKSNPSSPTIKEEKIFSFSPSTDGYDLIETIQADISVQPFGVRVSCLYEGNNSFVTFSSGALADTDEVWCCLFYTQEALVSNAYGTFSGPLLPQAWLTAQRL